MHSIPRSARKCVPYKKTLKIKRGGCAGTRSAHASLAIFKGGIRVMTEGAVCWLCRDFVFRPRRDFTVACTHARIIETKC